MIFASRLRSCRELPLRLSDFGVLHRNEVSGALSGLSHGRRFQQDDAHIFWTEDQGWDLTWFSVFSHFVMSEFTYWRWNQRLFQLSHKFLWNLLFLLWIETIDPTWQVSWWSRGLESCYKTTIEEASNSFGFPWQIDPGDSFLYGPKIDITIRDALQRTYGCATIQLYFQLSHPKRFNLQYQT